MLKIPTQQLDYIFKSLFFQTFPLFLTKPKPMEPWSFHERETCHYSSETSHWSYELTKKQNKTSAFSLESILRVDLYWLTGVYDSHGHSVPHPLSLLPATTQASHTSGCCLVVQSKCLHRTESSLSLRCLLSFLLPPFPAFTHSLYIWFHLQKEENLT